MDTQHHYELTVNWTGDRGTGTSHYAEYDRSHTIRIAGKPTIEASSDAPFRGDVSKHNPEDLFLASLSTCHMLWYLHLCADAGVIVTGYEDRATGTLSIGEGNGSFTEVTLHPFVTVKDASMVATANALHKTANERCFIANSIKATVGHEPQCVVGG